MLAGLIRDEERTVLAGVPGLSDLPLIGRMFANNRKETLQTDIILTLTPHIVRALNVSEADLRPFRLGRAGAGLPRGDVPAVAPVPRDPLPPPAPPPGAEAKPSPPAFPQPLQGGFQLPGVVVPITPPKKPGGDGTGG